MFRKFIFPLFSLALVFTGMIAPTLMGAIGFNPTEAASIQQNPPLQTTPVSCIQPVTSEEKAICEQIEGQILAATVRIEMHTQFYLQGHAIKKINASHATIMAGRYLVTHNHFRFSLTEQVVEDGGQEGYMGISLRTTTGKILIENVPLSSFHIVHEDPQTLVFAFVDEYGNGLFDNARLPSAQFMEWRSVPWQAGMELAQVDWDGENAHVDWVHYETLNQNEGVPQIQIGNFPKKGCSGGGVFWNGVHVGNTWAENVEEDPNTGEVIRRYSMIALNSAEMMDLAK